MESSLLRSHEDLLKTTKTQRFQAPECLVTQLFVVLSLTTPSDEQPDPSAAAAAGQAATARLAILVWTDGSFAVLLLMLREGYKTLLFIVFHVKTFF